MKRFALFVLTLIIGTSACCCAGVAWKGKEFALRVDEGFGSSNKWINELTDGLVIDTVYPQGAVTANTPLDFVITVTNEAGRYQPHLSYMYLTVEGENGTSATNVRCDVLSPVPVDEGANVYDGGGEVWFRADFPRVKVARGRSVSIKAQCSFPPGDYQVTLLPVFDESANAFTEICTSLNAR